MQKKKKLFDSIIYIKKKNKFQIETEFYCFYMKAKRGD